MNSSTQSRRARLWLGATLLAAMPLGVRAEEPWRVGLDVTLEASAGLGGAGQSRRTVQGLALVGADWERPDDGGRESRLNGHVSVLALAGHGPTGRFLGDFLAASNIEGDAGVRLYSWWLEAGVQGWSGRAGALLADEEFGGTDAGGNLMNSAFGWPAFVSANTVNTGPAFYIPALGFRLEHRWSETTAWRVGIYDGDSFDSLAGDPAGSRHGLHHQLGGSQGCFLIGEGTFALTGRATRCKLGFWLHTADFPDVRDDAEGRPFALSGNDPRIHSSNRGGYAVIEHTLTDRVELFVRGGFSPADRNTLGWALDTGLAWTGPLPGRPTDVVAVGLAHARFSSRLGESARLADPSVPAPDHEQVIELSYTVALGEGFTIQPDLQFIRHPGGSSAQRDASVFLLRLNRSY